MAAENGFTEFLRALVTVVEQISLATLDLICFALLCLAVTGRAPPNLLILTNRTRAAGNSVALVLHLVMHRCSCDPALTRTGLQARVDENQMREAGTEQIQNLRRAVCSSRAVRSNGDALWSRCIGLPHENCAYCEAMAPNDEQRQWVRCSFPVHAGWQLLRGADRSDDHAVGYTGTGRTYPDHADSEYHPQAYLWSA